MTDTATTPRPRVEGDREQEILTATLTVLAEVGYDRLTMDAVAAEAKASKATLYRRWSSKPQLVVDAVLATKDHPVVPDTGSLRGDLLASYCGLGGLDDARAISVLAGVVTAITRDEEFAHIYRRDFLGPKQAAMRQLLERAVDRGEIRADVDLDLIGPALPGIVLHRVFLLGDTATPDLVARVVDQVILPALGLTSEGTP